MRENLVLIGMPGCGKSTCGVLAAKGRCVDFIDTDLLIQKREGMALQSIINERGGNYFAKVEEEVLCGVEDENTVIATGGSAVYSEKAMAHLRERGKIVYLKISLPEMLSRVQNITTRGILRSEGETLEDLYKRRIALYEKYADTTIDCDGKTVEDVVAHLCEL